MSFETTMQCYKFQIDNLPQQTSGAIFLGVFRGKISEGISLNDKYCRCVISMGIPFGNLSEPRVILKKCLLNDK
jgi:Rad3-related DNA helicase